MSSNIERAREFAIRVHGEQQYAGHPYSYHLDAVAAVLTPFGEQAQVAAYLHDTVEDCDVTIDDIAVAFGREMADCVAVLTDEPGENRKARKAKTNKKLAASTNSLALTVKAADRLSNLQESQRDSSNSKLTMYRREHEAFRKAVYRPGLCDKLWDQMSLILESTRT